MEEYNESDIQVLEGTEGVRHRPSMYIGDVGSRGLHHLVYEVIDNSVDEAMAGRCSMARVILHQDGSVSIRDDGAGIPSDIHPKYGVSTLEVILTKLHSGGKFGKKAYSVSGGLHGVGLSVVCALSIEFYVEVVREKKVYWQEYSRGKKLYDVQTRERKPEDKRGTLIRFKPDPEIFNTTEFNFDILAGRFKELAYLTEGFTIEFIDERQIVETEDGKPEPKKVVYHFEGGIVQFVQDTIQNRKKLDPDAPVFRATGEAQGVKVDIALAYTDSFQELIKGFVNNIDTREGGTHVSGFKTALTRTLNDFARTNKLLKDKEENLRGDDTREGLVAIISVKVPEPQFEGQTKTKLGNGEVDGIVQGIFGKQFKEFLQTYPTYAKTIIQKAVLSRRARLAAQKARELIRKSGSSRVSLPGKLYASREKDPMKRELFLVEGQSAGGTAVKARDAQNQEILFLRGKVLNVEKARLSKILDNAEIRNIITAVGTGIDDDFDISKLRYGKIVILTDADVDGLHIATLLLTLFYRHMRPLIEEGYVYMARPPLYKVQFSPKSIKLSGKPYVYLTSDRDLEALKIALNDMNLSTKDIVVSRFKGLGEMNADQLEETVMNPMTRRIERVIIADSAKTERWITKLMGDDIAGRKKFINEEVFSEEEEHRFGEFYTLAFEEEKNGDLDLDEVEEDLETDQAILAADLISQLEDWTHEPQF
ncbi:MAG: DNA gyrase subunit B [Methanobacteriota archaeon]|nr:MAG: DNA gyrase subunit B [Euryarchaeota archaeon]